jgi:putative SOS response-associated peptidase YedK
MCNHYQAESHREQLERMGLELSAAWKPPGGSTHIQQTDWAPFIRRPLDHESGSGVTRGMELAIGRFGMLPVFAPDMIYIRHNRTHNARAEKVAELSAFMRAWSKPWHCIVPCEAIYAPDWRSGEHVPTRFMAASGGALGVAGLWCPWKNPATRRAEASFTMLTINADHHPLFGLMQQFDKMRPVDKQDRRMPVILPESQYGAWLDASSQESTEFMRHFPAEKLTMRPEPGRPSIQRKDEGTIAPLGDGFYLQWE